MQLSAQIQVLWISSGHPCSWCHVSFWNERRDTEHLCLCPQSSQQQQTQAGETEGKVEHGLDPLKIEGQNLPEVEEEEMECNLVNGKVVKSNSEAHLNPSSGMWLIWFIGSPALMTTEQLIKWFIVVTISETSYRLCLTGHHTIL